MIKKLSIKNFKSIKELDIECKKVNLFIGEPNAGKSNILESLGLLSWCGYMNTEIKEYVRFQGIQNLFYDDLFENIVEIEFEKVGKTPIKLNIKFESNQFLFQFPGFSGVFDYSNNLKNKNIYPSIFNFIKFYRFIKQDKFPEPQASYLLPAHGNNMFSVVRGNKKFRETMSNFFKTFGFQLVLKPQEKTFEFQKQVDDEIIQYPYILLSDTIQRIIFYTIAIESNKDSTLIFEEPESHAFPYYTKYLGEKIGFDETNQYFIATHNPYLLMAILEKAKKDDVNVFVTYFKDYQTKLKSLSNDEISDLMNYDYDPFFNLNHFIDEEN